MLSKMKPLPKALIIAVLVAIPIWVYVTFSPNTVETTGTQSRTQLPQVGSEAAISRAQQVEDSAKALTDKTTSDSTVPDPSNSGLEAVLRAGKK